MKFRAILLFCLLLLAVVFAQPQTTGPTEQAEDAPPQTARQALVEMMTGGSEAMKRHMTLEMQKSLETKSVLPDLDVLSQIKSSGADLQVFETGQVLLAASEPGKNEKFEVHVDSDDLSGDTDNIDLSFHQFQDGVEQDIPYAGLLSRFTVGLKRQASIWRLNEISINLKVPVGDPSLLERMEKNMTGGGMVGGKIAMGNDGKSASSRELPIEQTVSMMAFAEVSYANSHPDAGFTCILSDLAKFNFLKADDRIFKGEPYKGYKFSLNSCQGKPAESFHLVAEPVSPVAGARAYCTDATRNVRMSDDGRGSTCLISGKVRNPAENEGAGEDPIIRHSTKKPDTK
ncbi:MAG TPA: hypothetical protein VJW20_18990 [Candidatus Angelobacter sp.]|nr:hypothetical protein [Candidatus Angelobacter sp.]